MFSRLKKKAGKLFQRKKETSSMSSFEDLGATDENKSVTSKDKKNRNPTAKSTAITVPKSKSVADKPPISVLSLTPSALAIAARSRNDVNDGECAVSSSSSVDAAPIRVNVQPGLKSSTKPNEPKSKSITAEPLVLDFSLTPSAIAIPPARKSYEYNGREEDMAISFSSSLRTPPTPEAVGHDFKLTPSNKRKEQELKDAAAKSSQATTVSIQQPASTETRASQPSNNNRTGTEPLRRIYARDLSRLDGEPWEDVHREPLELENVSIFDGRMYYCPGQGPGGSSL
jgi:hypothetical protein